MFKHTMKCSQNDFDEPEPSNLMARLEYDFLSVFNSNICPNSTRCRDERVWSKLPWTLSASGTYGPSDGATDLPHAIWYIGVQI